MTNLEYIIHNSFKDYEKNQKNFSALKKQKVTEMELIRCAHTVGFSGFSLFPIEVLNWKESVIPAFIDFSDPSGELKIKNLGILESSEKGSLFYSLGMIFAQYHVQKNHPVRHLAHLKNNGIYPVNKSRITQKGIKKEKKSPDLWGPVDKDNSYLVEAKGSSQYGDYIGMDRMIDAREQLESIIYINYNLDSKRSRKYRGANMTRLIVATFPRNNKTIMQQIVDPIGDDEGVIVEVNPDVMVYHYYASILQSLKFRSSEIIDIKQNEFKVFVSPNGYKIGVLKEVYGFLSKRPHNNIGEVDIVGVSEEVNSILDNKIGNNAYYENNLHIGIDGMIVISTES